MRLLVVSQYFWPENFRINDLVSELVARGHAVTVLTGCPNYPDGEVFADFRANPRAFDTFAGASVVRVPMLARGKGGLRLALNYFTFALSGATIGAWKLRGRRFDAIFVFEVSPVTVGLPAIVQRWLKKAPVAFWVLDLWPETLEAIGVVRSKRVLGLVAQLVRFIYRRCDLLLAQSRGFIPQIRKYSGDTEVRYFPQWAEAVHDAAEAAAAPEVPLQPGAFTIVFTGNIGDAQDFPTVIDAAERLKTSAPQVRWVIVGDGRLADWVREQVAQRGLTQQVLLPGRFPVERMPSFYRHADALLVSLKPEPIFAMTLPGKLQGYLAAGVPILAMLDGEGAQVITDAVAGVAAKAGDAQALAAAVLRLAALTPQERHAMGARGRQLGATEFDRGRQIGKLEAWLGELRHPAQAAAREARL
ncbi:glycosyltransferase family 4 protein [Ramlibacter sp. PS3R-8]|uniref:glycosyltransferase family 4 protein n=1 Tax=Ramlibacter sp. PS3R-8 TaxID=3133437 RepID=UPI0030B2D126